MAISDPLLGTVFYTLDQDPAERPVFVRETNRCLTCHGALKTRNVPGVQIRSIFVDSAGDPIIGLGMFELGDHSTPLASARGGWYVTGSPRLATTSWQSRRSSGKTWRRNEPNSSGQNITELHSRVDKSRYLSKHSDIVALMVLRASGGSTKPNHPCQALKPASLHDAAKGKEMPPAEKEPT